MTKGFTDNWDLLGPWMKHRTLRKQGGISGEKRMKEVSKTPMLQVWERYPILGEGTNLEKKMSLVWDILSFKWWQNNPKRMSSTELEEPWGWKTVSNHTVRWVRPVIYPALHLKMALIYVSWESMVIALYDILLRIFRIPSHPNVLNVPFIKTPSPTNLIKSFKLTSFFT